MSRSLEQLDNDLGVIEALLEDAPVQDMDEMSFPIAEKALNSLQWQAVSVATGSGIADRGGRPFWLRDLSNTTDSATLTTSVTTKTAEASIMGFFFQMKKDVQVPLPPVSTTTTYHVGLEFDPTRLKDETGPIRRVVHKNTIPYTGGKIYLPLWEVTRNPNQLLSDATVVQKRPKLSPQIHVDYPESMPDPRTQLWGTTCYIRMGAERGATYLATGSSEETGGPTTWESFDGWFDLGDGSHYVWAGHGEKRAVQVDGKTRRMRGRLTQANGDNFRPSDGGYLMYKASDRNAPKQATVCVVSGWGTRIPTMGVVRCERNGEIRFYPKEETGWVDLTGVQWYVN